MDIGANTSQSMSSTFSTLGSLVSGLAAANVNINAQQTDLQYVNATLAAHETAIVQQMAQTSASFAQVNISLVSAASQTATSFTQVRSVLDQINSTLQSNNATLNTINQALVTQKTAADAISAALNSETGRAISAENSIYTTVSQSVGANSLDQMRFLTHTVFRCCI